MEIYEPVDLMYFRPISLLYEKFHPRNIIHMPAVNFSYASTSNENPVKSTDSFMMKYQENTAGKRCVKSCYRGIMTSRMEGSAALVERSLNICDHSARFA